jgi:hypothetical protein
VDSHRFPAGAAITGASGQTVMLTSEEISGHGTFLENGGTPNGWFISVFMENPMKIDET